MIRFSVLAAVLALAVAAPAGPVAADEAKSDLRASMLLSVLSTKVESRQTAYDEALRDEGPPVAERSSGVVQPDGSVRYGSATVTVRNPCPPGTAHYEPPPLPGRRARN